MHAYQKVVRHRNASFCAAAVNGRKRKMVLLSDSENKIEETLTRMKARCEKQARDPMKVEREVGRMLGKSSRAAKLFPDAPAAKE